MNPVRLVLPYPVSANRYWRPVPMKGRSMIVPTSEAKVYKEEIKWIALRAGVRKPLTCRVILGLQLYPERPADWAKRTAKDPAGWDDTVRCIDLGNAEKVLSDALQGIAFVDDKQIWEMHKQRMEPDALPARVVVTVTPLARRVIPQLDLLAPRRPEDDEAFEAMDQDAP